MSEFKPPKISVVVFAREASSSIRALLKSLLTQQGIEDAEIIVADCSTDGTSEILTEEFPEIRRLALGPLSMPQGKARAIKEARGGIIAIIDAHDRAEPGWLSAIAVALESPEFEAVGGEVIFDGPAHGINAAGYLFEYGAFAPPGRAGATLQDLPGNNVAYRRTVFDTTCRDMLDEGFWKPFYHRRMRDRGDQLGLVENMRVKHHIPTDLFAFCRRRYHYGRCFGAMRLAEARGVRAAVLKVFAPAALPILCYRHTRAAWAHPTNRALLRACLPELLLLSCSWAAGEWVGAWVGPGDACDTVY